MLRRFNFINPESNKKFKIILNLIIFGWFIKVLNPNIISVNYILLNLVKKENLKLDIFWKFSYFLWKKIEIFDKDKFIKNSQKKTQSERISTFLSSRCQIRSIIHPTHTLKLHYSLLLLWFIRKTFIFITWRIITL